MVFKKTSEYGDLSMRPALRLLCRWGKADDRSLNATVHIPGPNSATALLLFPLILREANEARQGRRCEC